MDMKTLLTDYYSRAYKRWRIDEEKAGKDIVGEEYELTRSVYWSKLGLSAKSETIAGYDADLIVRDQNNKIIAIEEDKAHYVDSCFLDRFMMNAARVFKHFIDQGTKNEDIPPFILSCMTTYNLFEEKYESNKSLFSSKIQKLMDEKVKYLPMCEHDRVRAGKYFKSTNISFDFSDKLIQEQSDFIDSLGVQNEK